MKSHWQARNPGKFLDNEKQMEVSESHLDAELSRLKIPSPKLNPKDTVFVRDG